MPKQHIRISDFKTIFPDEGLRHRAIIHAAACNCRITPAQLRIDVFAAIGAEFGAKATALQMDSATLKQRLEDLRTSTCAQIQAIETKFSKELMEIETAARALDVAATEFSEMAAAIAANE